MLPTDPWLEVTRLPASYRGVQIHVIHPTGDLANFIPWQFVDDKLAGRGQSFFKMNFMSKCIKTVRTLYSLSAFLSKDTSAIINSFYLLSNQRTNQQAHQLHFYRKYQHYALCNTTTTQQSVNTNTNSHPKLLLQWSEHSRGQKRVALNSIESEYSTAAWDAKQEVIRCCDMTGEYWYNCWGQYYIGHFHCLLYCVSPYRTFTYPVRDYVLFSTFIHIQRVPSETTVTFY